VPAISGHSEAKQGEQQDHGDQANHTTRPRRLEALRRSTATATAMAALRRECSCGGAKRAAAHLRYNLGRGKVETMGKVEAKLRERLIGGCSGG